MERTITRDRFLDIYVPAKLHGLFIRNQKYLIVFDSVEPVANGVGLSELNLNRGESALRLTRSGDRNQHAVGWQRNPADPILPHRLKAQVQKPEGKAVSFALTKSWIEKDTNLTFQVGRKYQIKGTLEGICRFDSVIRETGYSEVHDIYVPRDIVAKFKAGQKYDVQVDEIKEIIKEPNPTLADGFWDWKTVAAWTDTEGQYQSGRSRFRAVISQDEREPLDGICDFLLGEEIPSIVYDMGNGHYQLRTLGGMEALAKFVQKTEPYIRTRNKKNQIAKFKEMLSTNSKGESVHKRNARRILGL